MIKMKFVFDMLKGAVIGIANVIPGVSGGTMAVAMGIYDKLIHALTHIFKEFKKSFNTVLPIGIGMVIGIAGLSMIIDWMFGVIPIQTNLLFIGLILGGVPLIYQRVKGAKLMPYHVLGFIVLFALVVGLSFVQQSTEKQKEAMDAAKEAAKTEAVTEDKSDFSDYTVTFNVPDTCKYLGAGVVASATMVVPGVSGSMMMMVMGLYELIIASVSTLVKALLAGNISVVLQTFCVLIPFGIGTVAGIVIIAKLIEMLLNKCPVMTFYCILGLIIGSPFAIVVVNLDIFKDINVVSIITGIITFAIGFVIAYFLSGDKAGVNEGIDRELKEIEEDK